MHRETRGNFGEPRRIPIADSAEDRLSHHTEGAKAMQNWLGETGSARKLGVGMDRIGIGA